MTDTAEIQKLQLAYDKACRAWSRDDLTDITATMLLGEALYFASVELISALEDQR